MGTASGAAATPATSPSEPSTTVVTATAPTASAGSAASGSTPASADKGAHAAELGEAHFQWTEDATKSFYNGALRLPWATEVGAWRDRSGTSQGSLAYASVAFVDRPDEQVARWDVTDLVREHGADMLIRRSGGKNAKFHSRQAAAGAKHPRLLVTRGGRTTTYEATADTTLSSTTTSSLGKATTLSTAEGFLVKFDVGADAGIERAVLELTATTEQYGNQTLSVYRTDARPKELPAPAIAYGTDADIILRLTGDAWKRPSYNGFRADRMAVNTDGSLTVTVPTGSDTGSEAIYAIPKAARQPVMFARMVMMAHVDWDPGTGGKFPGLANTGQADKRTASLCGWGSRTADGTCWSARTKFHPTIAGTRYAKTHQALSPYAYRVNRKTFNGEGPAFVQAVPKGKYFVLDQMVKLNSVNSDGTANADGEVTYWINGKLAGRMTDVVWRSKTGPETLPSELWLDAYVGGTGYKAPHPHGVTFKEVIVSTKLLPFKASELAELNGGNA